MRERTSEGRRRYRDAEVGTEQGERRTQSHLGDLCYVISLSVGDHLRGEEGTGCQLAELQKREGQFRISL